MLEVTIISFNPSRATSSVPRRDMATANKEEGERVLHFCDGVVLKIVPIKDVSIFDEQLPRIVTEAVRYQPELICEPAKKLRRRLSRRVSLQMKSLAAVIHPSDHKPEEAFAAAQLPRSDSTELFLLTNTAQQELLNIPAEILPFTSRQHIPRNSSGPDPIPTEKVQNSPTMKNLKDKNFLEENLSSLFPFSRPDLFFEFVHALMMLISLFLAAYLTNFVSCSAAASWKVISLVPAIASIIAFIALVRTAALIQAVYRVNYKAILEVRNR